MVMKLIRSHFLFISIVLCYFVFAGAVSAQSWNIFNTDYGYIQLGPGNDKWAHIYTDRSDFIFNKDIHLIEGLSSYYKNDLWLKTGGITRLWIQNSSGNVGIGTGSPLEKLHVNGNLLIPANKELKFGTDNSQSGFLTISNSASSYNTYINIKGHLYFRNTNQGHGMVERVPLSIQSDGTVLVNVWENYDASTVFTDGHQFMVNGAILCERVKIIGDVPDSDDVFEPGYPLRSLSELERHILTHKHLPDVPSAAEFKDQGYDIGKMDDILLRKVEELTLYVIELKKEIEALKKQGYEAE